MTPKAQLKPIKNRPYTPPTNIPLNSARTMSMCRFPCALAGRADQAISDLTLRDAMPANLIAFLVQGIRAPSGVGTDMWEHGGGRTA